MRCLCRRAAARLARKSARSKWRMLNPTRGSPRRYYRSTKVFRTICLPILRCVTCALSTRLRKTSDSLAATQTTLNGRVMMAISPSCASTSVLMASPPSTQRATCHTNRRSFCQSRWAASKKMISWWWWVTQVPPNAIVRAIRSHTTRMFLCRCSSVSSMHRSMRCRKKGRRIAICKSNCKAESLTSRTRWKISRVRLLRCDVSESSNKSGRTKRNSRAG